MLGILFKRYRSEYHLNQAELAKRLTEAGWKLGLSRVSNIEKAAEGEQDIYFKAKHIECFSKVSGYDVRLCYFWAQRIPRSFYGNAESAGDKRIMIGMGVLAASAGSPEAGPPLTHEAALKLGLRPAVGSPREEAAVEQELLSQSVPPAEIDRELREVSDEMGLKEDKPFVVTNIFGNESVTK